MRIKTVLKYNYVMVGAKYMVILTVSTYVRGQISWPLPPRTLDEQSQSSDSDTGRFRCVGVTGHSIEGGCASSGRFRIQNNVYTNK